MNNLMVRIMTSFVWCKKRSIKRAALFCLFLFALLSGQRAREEYKPFCFSKEERKWLDKFMRDVMLDEGCIYTLWGTKPVTAWDIHYFTPEEAEALCAENVQHEDVCYLYNIDQAENWEKWKEKWKELGEFLHLYRYLWFEEVREGDPRTHTIFFVNIRETARVLEENYSFFSKVAEMEFDPVEIVYDMEKKTTSFWKKITKNSIALGILFGYGKDNATYFTWKVQETENQQVRNLQYSIRPKFSEKFLHYGYSSIAYFPLPQFASYFLHDPVLKKYEEERKAIQVSYRGRNFLDLTLEKLTD